MRDQSGFALVVLLIFVSILSELIISMLNSTLFASKTLENFTVYSRYSHIANVALQQAKKDITEGNSRCFNHECPVQREFLKDHETLTYRIDFLATEPCFKIKDSEKPGADFFKISVNVGNNHSDAMNVQSTFVKSAITSVICHQIVKTIGSGFLSWRVVDSS